MYSMVPVFLQNCINLSDIANNIIKPLKKKHQNDSRMIQPVGCPDVEVVEVHEYLLPCWTKHLSPQIK